MLKEVCKNNNGFKEDKFVLAFVEFIKDRLKGKDKLEPELFLLHLQLAINDLEKGIDSYTSEPITGEIAEYSKSQYQILRLVASDIAEMVYDEEFSEKVEIVLSNVKKIVNESL